MDFIPNSHTGLTTTQTGSIAEHIVAAQLMLVSDGRLSPYLPLADDHGMDMLVMDKIAGTVAAIQIKARYAEENNPPRYVQFDIRTATLRESEAAYILAVLIDPADGAFWRAWLIPTPELRSISADRKTKLTISPNPSLQSRDRYAQWRCRNARAAAQRLLSA